MFVIRLTCPLLLLLLLPIPLVAAELAADVSKIGEFEVHSYRYTGGAYKGEEFRYLLLRPMRIEAGRRYPLVVFLHGAGERGNDPARLLPHFPTQMAKPEWRKKYPCFLLVPQCRNGKMWMKQHWSEKESKPLDEKPTDQMQMALEILDKSRKDLPVDPGRIYLTGLSMGGYGAWEMAMRRPELFAALAPVCGGGDESKANRLKQLAVWTAHGDADGAVPVERTRRLVAAIRKAGGNVRYTEYAGVGHNSWTRFYADKQGVVPWMFAQERKKPKGTSRQSRVDFSREIRPLLAKSCFGCHGNDPETREAELRLDVRGDAIRIRDGRRAIVPHKSSDSELVHRLLTKDLDAKMPPADAGKPLSEEQITLLRRWIDEGAEYEEHWAFVKPRQAEMPTVSNSDWPRNEIDYFVMEVLDRRGLKPAPEADRQTLIRRLSLDLTGLPPTPREVDEFVNNVSDNAYERLVERLLKSPRFGERWAQMWLDLARYADSMGYEKDLPRTIWRYRDWVVAALNRNQPFDQFTIEQLAGDLLPNATLEQKLATAFHRNTLTNQEGGTDDEEFRVAAVKDRVDTTLQVWMGLTMGCAKCHSHKYDPISQQEYYQVYAVFNQSADADRGDDAPTLLTPTADQQRQVIALNQQLAGVEKQFVQFQPSMQKGFESWLDNVANDEKSRQKLPEAVSNILGTESKKRSSTQVARLQAYFARHLAGENVDARKLLASLTRKRTAMKIPRTPVMQELPSARRRETRIHIRGNFLQQGDVVQPAVPATFGQLPQPSARNRLALAQWLVHPDNPLTSRVQVNRFWARIFGRGIVLTEEDFGTQGTPPTHPELLDWLAVNFMKRGWSVKGLLRQIVNSATYRQSSRRTLESTRADPDNRWLGRGPRFRLEAETVRDQALSAAGLLGKTIGGPSVMPPQPAGLWKVTYSKLKWKTSAGEDRHRRALYTYWRRTSPYPSMLTFDAGTRETCVLRRVRTNTPLQALVTLNDPVYVEAAGGLASRMLGEAKPEDDRRIEHGFRLLLARKPVERELKRLAQLLEQSRASFRDQPKSAEALLAAAGVKVPPGSDVASGEFASWVVLANAMLNLDETMMKP